jgi:hypothetical protein
MRGGSRITLRRTVRSVPTSHTTGEHYSILHPQPSCLRRRSAGAGLSRFLMLGNQWSPFKSGLVPFGAKGASTANPGPRRVFERRTANQRALSRQCDGTARRHRRFKIQSDELKPERFPRDIFSCCCRRRRSVGEKCSARCQAFPAWADRSTHHPRGCQERRRERDRLGR